MSEANKIVVCRFDEDVLGRSDLKAFEALVALDVVDRSPSALAACPEGFLRVAEDESNADRPAVHLGVGSRGGTWRPGLRRQRSTGGRSCASTARSPS